MTSPRTRRLAVLASGQGTNLRALLEAERAGQLGGAIVLVLSDRAEAGALQVARSFGVDAEVLPVGKSLAGDAEAAYLARLARAEVDTIVLAGFMRILHAPFLAAYPGKILNVHPSLLPAFPGSDAIAAALAHGVRVTGCTVHLVDAGVDEGPILAQAAVEIPEGDTLESLTARIHEAEHRLYPATVRDFLTRSQDGWR